MTNFFSILAYPGPESMRSLGPVSIPPLVDHGPTLLEDYPQLVFKCVARKPRDMIAVKNIAWSERLYARFEEDYPGCVWGHPITLLNRDGTLHNYRYIQSRVVVDPDPTKYQCGRYNGVGAVVGAMVVSAGDLTSPIFAVRAHWSAFDPEMLYTRFPFCTEEFIDWFKRNRFTGALDFQSNIPAHLDRSVLNYVIE